MIPPDDVYPDVSLVPTDKIDGVTPIHSTAQSTPSPTMPIIYVIPALPYSLPGEISPPKDVSPNVHSTLVLGPSLTTLI
jgi:hypothetical protein